MKYTLVLIFVLLASFSSIAQSSNLEADTAKAAAQLRRANQAVLDEDFDRALPDLQAAIQTYRHYELWKRYFWAKSNLISYYTRKYYTHGEEELYRSKAIAEELLVESRERLGEGNYYEGQAEDALGWFYTYLGFSEKALGHFERSMLIQSAQMDSTKSRAEDWVNWGVQYYNLASVYQDLGKTREALEAFHEAARIFKRYQNEAPPAGPTALFNYVNALIMLGGNYSEQGKQQLAREYAEEARQVAEAKSSKNRTRMAFIYETLGNVERAAKNYAAAIPYFEQAVAICLESEALNRPILARIYKALAHTHRLEEAYEVAADYLRKVETLYQELPGDYHRELVDLWSQQAALAFDQKDYPRSEALFQQSNERHLRIFGDKPDLQLSSNYLGLAKLREAQQQLGEALDYSLKAVAYLHRAAKPLSTESWSLNAQTPLLSESALLEVLSFRAALLHRLYQEKEVRRYLEDVLQLVNFAQPLLEKLRLNYSEAADKAQLFEHFQQLYQVGVAAYLDLYDIEGKREAYAKAFELAEANKSVLLLESLQNEQALAYGGLPDSLILKEQQLQARIRRYDKKWVEAELAGEEEKIKLYRAELLSLRQQYEAWQQQLRETYPEYHALRYEQEPLSLQAVQAYLKDGTCLLEYFEGKENLFLFYIRQDSFHYKRLYFPTMDSQVEELRNWLTDVNYRSSHASDLNVQLFAQLAQNFYQKVIGDLVFPKEATLLIIPDGALNYIPFEVLLTQESGAKQYGELPYLLKKHPIHYAFSMRTLLQEGQAQAEGNGQLLAFAASYSAATDSLEGLRSSRSLLLRGSLQDLPGARQEVKRLEESLTGAFFYEAAANERRFKELAPDYSVIHLAMHGYLDRETPMLSSLVFTENADTTEDNFLHAYELSNMNLQAELVVLSACETGYGSFQQGEGVLSLARSFRYAGVPSLVMSLWSVNDQATAYIMEGFYQELAAGHSKAEALRQAKLSYLKQAKGREAHPSFWSPFVQMGAKAPVELQQGGSSLAVWMGSGIAVILGLLLFSRAYLPKRRKH